MIALASTSQFGQTGTGSAQYQWLQNDLKNTQTSCRLAYFHHPVFDIGPEGNTTSMNAIWALLAANGVDIVLTGHDHDYQRWTPLDGTGAPSPTGITQFVVGAGGHGIQNFVRTDTRVVTAFDTAQTFGALRLELNSTGAAFSYINTQGSVFDSGTVSCNPAAADTTPPTVPTGLTSAAGPAPVNLTWTGSTDNVGVAGYTVYRNNAAVGSVNGNVTSFADWTAALGTTYTYAVDAFDTAGNRSAPTCMPICALTCRTGPPG